MIRLAAARTLTLLLLTAALVSCQPPAGSAARPPVELPAAAAIAVEPSVRVRIVANTDTARFDAPGGLSIGAGSGSAAPRRFAGPVTVTRQAGRFLIQDGRGTVVASRLPALRLRPAAGDTVQVNTTRYPNAVALVPAGDGRFDVINHLPIESYLPGVLDRELYDSWEPEAYAAQAIAARSYALFERVLRADKPYDLEATTASQVYGGATSNAKALEGVRRTRGQVLVYGGRVVPAFYSSCCGGVGQDARVAFPRHGKTVDMPPLHGGYDDGCTISPHRNWGPIRRDARTLAARIAGWGRVKTHPVAALAGLRAIQLTHRSNTGRPAVFRITDERGQHYDLIAEHFRFACNYAGGALPDLPRDQQLKSSHVRVTLTNGSVLFTDGHGFGHGVGLCQWGAQGLAQQGYVGRDIAERFYPGAQVQRIY